MALGFDSISVIMVKVTRSAAALLLHEIVNEKRYMKLDGSDYAVHRGNSKTRTIVYYISGINDGYIKIVTCGYYGVYERTLCYE